ncbi:hypothetical protein Ciccas_007515 [Cichlidogyrus casuarinus]|uniref:Uncharacterized protein n=1 Tax=Cichlidogyrus casuarinus TaxID=1844966 RepID=A0ABD2Q2N1_9PLAT
MQGVNMIGDTAREHRQGEANRHTSTRGGEREDNAAQAQCMCATQLAGSPHHIMLLSSEKGRQESAEVDEALTGSSNRIGSPTPTTGTGTV